MTYYVEGVIIILILYLLLMAGWRGCYIGSQRRRVRQTGKVATVFVFCKHHM